MTKWLAGSYFRLMLIPSTPMDYQFILLPYKHIGSTAPAVRTLGSVLGRCCRRGPSAREGDGSYGACR